MVLQAKKMSVGGSWNLPLVESKIREKIHERVGGTGVFEVSLVHVDSEGTVTRIYSSSTPSLLIEALYC